ncbi:hypothetical protein [Candidatus Epulonipiscium viviparus]
MYNNKNNKLRLILINFIINVTKRHKLVAYTTNLCYNYYNKIVKQ